MFFRGRHIGWRSSSVGFYGHVLSLIGHLAASALIFVVIFTLGWGIGFVVHRLNAVLPFSERILGIIEKIEVSILYLDVTISGIVLLVGSVRFIRDVMEGSRR